MFVWLGDWTYLILIPGIIAALVAQIAVKNAYSKYSSIQCGARITGAEIARKNLDQYGAMGITVEITPGVMSDHYDPRSNVIRLSQDVYNGTSIAALGIAAHESGHALQHAEHYAPLSIRNAILPIANIGSAMAFPLVILGLLFDFAPFLADIGVLLFGFVLLFQLITLPVEFNASRRAMYSLRGEGILSSQEAVGARKMLTAAAMTYVAAILVSLLQFLRLIALSNRNR